VAGVLPRWTVAGGHRQLQPFSEFALRTIPRALWLLATDGSSRRLLVPGTAGAVEFPRWSSDGTMIMVILQSGHQWSSPGSLLLVRGNPRSGKMVKRVDPGRFSWPLNWIGQPFPSRVSDYPSVEEG
jgi:hypothetical protein